MSVATISAIPQQRPISVVRPVRGVVRPVAKPAAVAAAKPQLRQVVRVVGIGAGAIFILTLLLNIGLSQSVYQLAHLKNAKQDLAVQSQVISQQVDSLSSQQNLANSAASLGMVANANPVFIRIADAKVFGKPAAAVAGLGRVAKNNLANAALTDSSVMNLQSGTASSTISSTFIAAPNQSTVQGVTQGQYVATPPAKTGQVAFSSGVIPASPTH